MPPLARRILRELSIFLVLVLAGLLVVLYLLQERMIFPGAETQGAPEAIVHARPGTELVKLTTPRGETVTALFGPALSPDGKLLSDSSSRPTLLYFYGNAMCLAYAEAYDVPVVILRYFSVYGPRQRPDMGYHRFIRALLRDEPVVVYGDGQQVRGNTYVSDCVRATVAAVGARPGEVYNVGGGETATVWDVLRRLEALAGHPARVRREAARPGDQRHTFADTTKLTNHLGWAPETSLDEGLARQWAWQEQELSADRPAAVTWAETVGA